jgi:hypothetical protein
VPERMICSPSPQLLSVQVLSCWSASLIPCPPHSFENVSSHRSTHLWLDSPCAVASSSGFRPIRRHEHELRLPSLDPRSQLYVSGAVVDGSC